MRLAGGTLSASRLTVAWASYGIIDESPSNNITIADSVLRNNTIGLYVQDQAVVALVTGTSITDSTTGITANAGTVSFRGQISRVGMGIRACNWESKACSVDAAYVDWGSPGACLWHGDRVTLGW